MLGPNNLPSEKSCTDLYSAACGGEGLKTTWLPISRETIQKMWGMCPVEPYALARTTYTQKIYARFNTVIQQQAEF